MPPKKPTPARFTRVLRRGDTGTDVQAISRAYIRANLWPQMTLTKFGKLPVKTRLTFDANRAGAQRRLEKQLGAKRDGIYARSSHEELVARGVFDSTSIRLLKTWKPPEPPLIEPKQGFDSLHPSLHRVYTMGRMRSFTDLGTYNPKATLPGSTNLSDHASSKDCAKVPSPPAKAIDFGIEPDTGWENREAREFVLAIWERPEIEYVILGDKIAIRGEGIRPYTAGGHLNHIHISGNRRTICL
jgi:hypothetical protein